MLRHQQQLQKLAAIIVPPNSQRPGINRNFNGRGMPELAEATERALRLDLCMIFFSFAYLSFSVQLFLLFRSVCDATSSGGFCGTSFAARDVNLPAALREVLCIHHLSFILCFRGVIFVCQVDFHLSSIFGATELQEQSFCIVFC